MTAIKLIPQYNLPVNTNIIHPTKHRSNEPYWDFCWWVYDHTNLFYEIPEDKRFSWKYLRIFSRPQNGKHSYRGFSVNWAKRGWYDHTTDT